MSFWQSPGGAATISAGASILDNAFGRSSSGMSTQRSQARKLRKQAYKIDNKWEPRLIASRMKGTVEGAKAAGLHPLFALGGGGSFSGGTNPESAAMGQSARGSGVSDAVQAALSAYQGTQLHTAQKDLIDAQADLSRARALEQVTSNDNAEAIIQNTPNPHAGFGTMDTRFQEPKKGEVDAHNKRYREQNLNVKSPVLTMRMGSQDVKLMVEEMDQLTEDPAAIAALTYFYHGNKNIDWPLLLQEYRHGKFMLPRQATGATKKAFRRMLEANARRARSRRLKARRPGVSDQFIPYSRGPHR